VAQVPPGTALASRICQAERSTSLIHVEVSAQGEENMGKRLILLLAVGVMVAADADAVKKEKAKLKGTWTVVSLEEEGKKQPFPEGVKMSLIFQDDKLAMQFALGDKKDSKEAAYVIDPAKKPAIMDITPNDGPEKGKTVRGIYMLDKDELKICGAQKPDNDRPKDFVTKEGSKSVLITLKRDKQ
jgi:uncharacterized protein (TIGR03067 family)